MATYPVTLSHVSQYPGLYNRLSQKEKQNFDPNSSPETPNSFSYGTPCNLADSYFWRSVLPHLTFRGPCITIYCYNKSQQDALFRTFILVKDSTIFGQTYSPSSGVLILYSKQLVFVILFTLTASEVPRETCKVL